LVPIALSGVYELLPIHTHHFYPSPLTLSVGEPISTEGMTLRQVEELNQRLREAIDGLRVPVGYAEQSGAEVGEGASSST
jgi:1-acyl-sn-glycerol-3-phosphate acyltransferase